MAAVTLSMVVGALKLIGVAPAVYDKLQKWKGKPTKKDKELLVKYSRRVDERRVFSARFDVEVVEACVGSLSVVTPSCTKSRSPQERALSATLAG